MTRPDREHDAGNATVEFALVSVVLVALVLAVLQVGFAVHVRNTLTAAAADGARYGAASGRTTDDAEQRTRALVASSLSDSFARDVRAGREEVDDLPTVVVEVRADLPVLGPWGPGGALRVRAHALAG